MANFHSRINLACLFENAPYFAKHVRIAFLSLTPRWHWITTALSLHMSFLKSHTV